MTILNVAVIGGGAAGFFAAISCKEHHPNAQVTLFEKSSKLLSKVKISGGGRCNVTHACFEPGRLSKFYPRGGKQLKKAFSQFASQDTVNWFEQKGVSLKTEDDQRIFPVSNDSQTIVDCLLNTARNLGIEIETRLSIEAIQPHPSGFLLQTGNDTEIEMDKVIIATGGSPKLSGLQWLADLGHQIQSPVPSLFTFNLPKSDLTQLMGVSVSSAQVRIQGTKQKQTGPLLITHWGISGPAVLKLSAWEARNLASLNYHFRVHICWVGEMKDKEIETMLVQMVEEHRKRKIANKNPFQLPQRLWLYLVEKAGLSGEAPWGNLGSKSINRLTQQLFNDEYSVQGKTTFKEEFVTCGGVGLQDVNFQTMESRVLPGMYFAGEVLDIDGITGGFNFQAAWTTGFIAGKLSRQ